MVNEKTHRDGAVITVKSTPLEEIMKDWSAEEKEGMAQAVISNANFKIELKQPK